MALKIFFGSLATDYINEQGRDAGAVADAIGGTSRTQFSKWKAGQWTYIAEDKLVRIILEVAGRDRKKQVNLMIAYLIDMTPEMFRPFIDIVPKTADEKPEPGISAKRWSPAVRAKVEAIGDAYARDADFMRMANQVAEWAKAINARAKKG
jgi:hypothetical protein